MVKTVKIKNKAFGLGIYDGFDFVLNKHVVLVDGDVEEVSEKKAAQMQEDFPDEFELIEEEEKDKPKKKVKK
jgi:hypothetical protein